MGFGLGVLQLSPDEFWAMTPKELAAAIDGRSGVDRTAPPGLDELAELMLRFPD